jgi:hypothetical protein
MRFADIQPLEASQLRTEQFKKEKQGPGLAPAAKKK